MYLVSVKGKCLVKCLKSVSVLSHLYQEAIDYLLPEAYSNAIDEAGIDPIDRPEISVEQIEKGKTFIFKATVQVKPEVKLGEYKGLEIEDFVTEVTDEEVEEEIKKLQERHAEISQLKKKALQKTETL